MASGRIESIDSPHGQRLEDKINAQRKMANEKLRELVPRVGKAKFSRWPTKLRRRLEQAGENQACENWLRKMTGG